MSMLENIVGQITSAASGGLTKPQGFDLNDDTFAKLLMKASEIQPIEEQNNMFSNLGAPAGFEIEPLDAVQQTQNIEFNPDDIEIKDLKISENYFSNLLNDNSNAMNLAKRHAANAYNLFGKGFVDTLGEFVGDAASMLK
ncbi:MAG: hypothetical protein NC408_08695 [Candidatus Gastranaerophilales bacterium]|nr:hypothetical protein [Candidatus Gastranaerophilales bacterium]